MTEVKRFMAYLPPDVYERLRRVAFDERVSMNEIVVEGIALALAQRRKKSRTKKGG